MSAVDHDATPTPIAATPVATDVVHRARPLHRHRRRARWTAALLGVAILVLAAACGGSKSSTTSAGATATTTGGSGSAAFTAYRNCLAKNGVKLPAGGGFRGGSGAAGGTGGAPTGTFPPGGFGGAGSGAGGGAAAAARNNPAFQKAEKACASLRPKTGFGGRGGAGSTAFQAFSSCMSSHGITLRPRGAGGSTSTTGSATPTSVDTSSPQYQAAYGICKALLPANPGSTTTTPA